MFEHGFPKDWSTLTKLIWLKMANGGGGGTTTLTGAIVSFIANASKAINSLVVTIKPQQSGSGDPSPDNVRPITGRTGAKVNRTGKNLCDINTDIKYGTGSNYNQSVGASLSVGDSSSAVSYTITDGVISVTNTTNWRGIAIFSNPLVKGETYKSLITVNSQNASAVKYSDYFVDENNKIVAKISNAGSLQNGDYVSFAFTPSEDGLRFAVCIECSSAMTVELSHVMISPSAQLTSVSDYEPYQGTTLTVTFPALGKNKFTTAEETTGYFLDSDCEELASSGWNCSNYIAVSPSTQYTFNPNTTEGSSAKAWYFDISKEPISYIASGEQTFTTPDNCYFMRFSYRDTSTNIQLEEGSSATSYEPFNNTVYGGSYEFVEGKLTDKLVKFSLDGNITYVLSYASLIDSNGTKSYFNIPSGIEIDKDSRVGYADSLKFKAGGIGQLTTVNSFVYEMKTRMRVYIANSLTGIVQGEDTQQTAAQKIKAYFTAHPCEVVCARYEPLEVQLTGQPISTLQGQNNIWSDVGDVAVTIPQNIIVT